MTSKIDRIINIIRILKEESPTMNVGDGQIAGTAEAGDIPPVKKQRKRYIYGGHGSRKSWIANFKDGTTRV